MSAFVNLNINHHREQNGVSVQALLTNVTPAHFNRPIFTATYRTNWSISHIPGPPPAFLTSSTLTYASNADYYPFWLLIVIAIFGSVTSVLTVLGNILVMLAFFLDRQIRQPTNYFILSLSVSDFLIGLLSMPLLTIYIYAKDWPLNAIICDIWLSLDYTVCLTSIYTVLFITIDRFCSVKMPAKYRKWRTKSRINIMIAITWAVPTLIFFSTTMVYPRLRGIANMQNGVCDVQWNKNQIFNLCLTIAYFWTTLFVMIVLYIFIYGVASNLEKKSQENARKMSSLVGMAGSAMTQIGVGIGVNKSPIRQPVTLPNCKVEANKSVSDNSKTIHKSKTLNQQLSNNSSERRPTNDNGDDENSNSFESHSDAEPGHPNEKKRTPTTQKEVNVNCTNHPTVAVNRNTSLRNPQQRRTFTTRPTTNVKSLAQSIYRNPIRLNGLSSKSKLNLKNLPGNSSGQTSMGLTPIPSEAELSSGRVYPPPQPRPETLAIMSEELFHERLRARQSPLLAVTDPSVKSSNASIVQPNQLSPRSSLVLQKMSTEDLSPSSQRVVIPSSPENHEEEEEEQHNGHDEHLLNISSSSEQHSPSLISQSQFSVKQILNNLDQASDDSWRLLNSHSSLDIPYIDETDFEDLGYILHRRCVPSNALNATVQEETIVYKSPTFIKHERRSRFSVTPPADGSEKKKSRIQEIYGNQFDAHKAILASPIFDSVELITYASSTSNPSSKKLPIRHCSLRHVPREILLKTAAPSPSSLPLVSSDSRTTSSIIFVAKAKTPLSQTPLNASPSTARHADVERALFDFYRCSQINDVDDLFTASESEALSNYKEINQETSSLLRLTEQYSSAFIDDEVTYPCPSNLMKMMVLNKSHLDTTSDDQTLTNSVSLNTYSQDCSVDKIYRPMNLNEEATRKSWTSSSSAASSHDRQIPQHFLTACEKKRTTSSDSDAITTTTTTLTTSTMYGGSDQRKKSGESKNSDLAPLLKKEISETFVHEANNRMASKVTFESLMTQTSLPSSPKTKDQCVMTQMDFKDPFHWSTELMKNGPELITVPRGSTANEGIATLTNTRGSMSTKSSVKELIQSQKSSNRRKSKSQNRARKALRTITFILGAFVVCWTPWHTYSAIHSLCESCKTNWIFTNPMFHCFYFLCYLNSPINPFCYALANQQFKKTFTRILKLDLRRL